MPNFASGCFSLSKIWYSNPKPDLCVLYGVDTKYFTPEFAPSLNLKSKFNS